MSDLGYFSLLTAFIISIYVSIVPVIGTKKQKEELILSAEKGTEALFFLVSVASFALLYLFLIRDFQNEYVANYSNRTLSVLYTIAAFWAGQKGSLLLWSWVLALCTVIVVWQNKNKNRELMPYVISILNIIQFFFLLLMVMVTDPFERLAYMPPDGKGLNPMLQNPGMIYHPLTLYLGYVGFAVPFAFAMAALITRQLGDIWIKSTRRWTIFAWFFLTLGNLFGAQWAYVELGWGGYWAWDPVENASFMPWLVGTAFLHSVMIQEKKDMLKVWNMALIVITFLLTIFGTFITRSGLISSVHSFGQSNLGPLFLGFLFLGLLFSAGLILSRLDMLKSKNELDSFISRESSFLFNNLILIGAAFATFWGTIFPMISEAVRGIKITVGPPFFNQVNVPIALALMFLTGICPLIAWRKASFSNLKKNFLIPFVVALVGLITFLALGMRHVYAVLSFFFIIFVLSTVVMEFYRGGRARKEMTGENPVKATLNLTWRNKRRYGGYIVHVGIMLMFIGFTGSSAFNVESMATLKPGESMNVKNYVIRYEGLSDAPSAHKHSVWANLRISNSGQDLGFLRPEKNFFKGQEQPTSEVAIRTTLKEDLYTILAGYDKDGTATLKVLVNPLVMWIWIGGGVLTIGAIIAMWPDRREKKRIAARYTKEELIETSVTNS
ncbi:MAG: heme lyase CcmF/NrfE family subunit [Candidatus Tectomicrobia bacterium]|uniref:Heme lyase CcmF/NrfE family subunit n=1 Tax=Tectimicrobiota bacterium TaxID=2528274 RepID=A0A933GK07_UNCTE|nr:heme lyase CcmF/NrfE family subunit [Candidatus Tectomicrobia bacterium]